MYPYTLDEIGSFSVGTKSDIISVKLSKKFSKNKPCLTLTVDRNSGTYKQLVYLSNMIFNTQAKREAFIKAYYLYGFLIRDVVLGKEIQSKEIENFA